MVVFSCFFFETAVHCKAAPGVKLLGGSAPELGVMSEEAAGAQCLLRLEYLVVRLLG